MTLKTIFTTAGLALAFAVSTGMAQATTFNIAEDVLPDGLGTLQAERAVWASNAGAPLSSEGFEGPISVGSSITFADFTVSVASGALTLFPLIELTRTEGEQSLGFSDSNVVTFVFNDAITSFGIDWSSLDRDETNIAYSDNAGGSNSDLFVADSFAGAGFLGATNLNGFTEISFTVTSSEILEFDNIQYASVAAVPVPAGLPLLLGAVGLIGLLRRKKA